VLTLSSTTRVDERDGKRPDGMTLVPWFRGRTPVLNFTCPDTLAPSHPLKTMFQAGAGRGPQLVQIPGYNLYTPLYTGSCGDDGSMVGPGCNGFY